MAKSKARKNVDENFKLAAVQRLQAGGVLANDLAKELGVSIWSLRKWSRQYRKRTAPGAGGAGEPAAPAAAPEALPAKPSSEPPVEAPVVDGGRRDRTDRIGDIVVGQAAGGAQNGGRDLETTFGRHAGIVSRLGLLHPEQ
jgi:transposase-like protein